MSMQVVERSTDEDGAVSEPVGTQHIVAAVQQQLRIELAPQLLNMAEPLMTLGPFQTPLHITLADGSKPTLQIHVSDARAAEPQ